MISPQSLRLTVKSPPQSLLTSTLRLSLRSVTNCSIVISLEFFYFKECHAPVAEVIAYILPCDNVLDRKADKAHTHQYHSDGCCYDIAQPVVPPHLVCIEHSCISCLGKPMLSGVPLRTYCLCLLSPQHTAHRHRLCSIRQRFPCPLLNIPTHRVVNLIVSKLLSYSYHFFSISVSLRPFDISNFPSSNAPTQALCID